MTEQDFDLLSAYLDGDLSDADRAALESRLAAEPELRRELEALRQTVALVRSLPVLKAPRSYALNAAMLEEFEESTADYQEMPANVTRLPAATRRRRPLTWLSAAAAVTVLFVIVAALLVNSQTGLFTPDDGLNGAAVAVMVTDTAAPTQALSPRSSVVTPTAAAADLVLEEAVEPAGSGVDSAEPAQQVGELADASKQPESAEMLNEQELPAQEADAADITDTAAEGTTLETFSMPGADAQTGASNAEPPSLFMIVPTGTAQAFDAAPVPQPTQASMGGAAPLPTATASSAPTQIVEMARAMPETRSQDAPPALSTGERLLSLLVAVLRALAQRAGLSLPE